MIARMLDPTITQSDGRLLVTDEVGVPFLSLDPLHNSLDVAHAGYALWNAGFPTAAVALVEQAADMIEEAAQ